MEKLGQFETEFRRETPPGSCLHCDEHCDAGHDTSSLRGHCSAAHGLRISSDVRLGETKWGEGG